MKTIQLTKGQVALVDDEDFEILIKYSWYAIKGKNTYYAATNVGGRKNRKTLLMHRVILGIEEKEMVADHKDHNGLNNQRDNLRRCTKSQNQYNRLADKDSAGSELKGVCFHKGAKKWQAQIQAGEVKKYLGLFETQQQAALAYNKEAVLLHGDFANVNKIAV